MNVRAEALRTALSAVRRAILGPHYGPGDLEGQILRGIRAAEEADDETKGIEEGPTPERMQALREVRAWAITQREAYNEEGDSAAKVHYSNMIFHLGTLMGLPGHVTPEAPDPTTFRAAHDALVAHGRAHGWEPVEMQGDVLELRRGREFFRLRDEPDGGTGAAFTLEQVTLPPTPSLGRVLHIYASSYGTAFAIMRTRVRT